MSLRTLTAGEFCAADQGQAGSRDVHVTVDNPHLVQWMR